MAMDTASTFDTYDPALGDAIRQGMGQQVGLPEYLGIRYTDVGPGMAAAELPVTEELLNPFGAAHGGVLATLVDHVLGAAVLPIVPAGTWPATLELKINYLAAVRPGVLRAQADVLTLGRRYAVVRVDATNEGKAVGAAQGTIALSRPVEP